MLVNSSIFKTFNLKYLLYVIISGFSAGIFFQISSYSFISSPYEEKGGDWKTAWIVENKAEIWKSILLWVAFYLIFWLGYSFLVSLWKKKKFSDILFLDAYTYLPSLLLLLSLLQFNSFITYLWNFSAFISRDLQKVLLLLAGSGILYLKLISWDRHVRLLFFKLRDRARNFLTALPFTWIAIGVFLVAWLTYGALGLYLISRLPVSGDEPHYLITTYSLLADHDIDVSNNFENKDYLQFMPGGRLRPGVQPLADGTIYPRHGIGLSMLILPFYYLGGRLGVVVFMNFLGAWLVVNILTLVYRITSDKVLSLLTGMLSASTIPLLFYPSFIYPEIPIAGLAVTTYNRISFPRGNPLCNAIIVGLCLACMPWLRERAIALVVPLLLLYLFRRDLGIRSKLLSVSIIALSGVAMLFYFYALYYRPSPNVGGALEGSRSLPAGVLRTFSIFGVFAKFFQWDTFIQQGFLGLLFSQEVGLLMYAPIYVLVFPGIVWMSLHRRREFLRLMGVILPTYLMAASYTHWWGGESPPARYMVAVVPFLTPFMAYSLGVCRQKFFRLLSILLGMISLYIAYVLAKFPVSLARFAGDTKNHFLSYYGPSIDLTRYFPSFFEGGSARYELTFLWGLLIVLICLYHMKHSVWISGSGKNLQGALLLTGGARETPLDPPSTNKNLQDAPLLTGSATVEESRKEVVAGLKYLSTSVVGALSVIAVWTILAESISAPRENTWGFHGHLNRFLFAMDRTSAFDYGVLVNDYQNDAVVPDLPLRFSYNVKRLAIVSFKEPYFMVAGPYETLPRGSYEATFWVKAGDITSPDKVASLDVVTNRGKRVLAGKILRGVDFSSAEAVQPFVLTFQLKTTTQGLETRVFFHDKVDIYVDRIEVRPQLDDLRLRAAKYFEKKGDFKRALKEYKVLLLQDPENPELQYHLGRIYEAQEEYLEAIEAYKKVLKKIPNHQEALSQLKKCYEKTFQQDSSAALQREVRYGHPSP